MKLVSLETNHHSELCEFKTSLLSADIQTQSTEKLHQLWIKVDSPSSYTSFASWSTVVTVVFRSFSAI